MRRVVITGMGIVSSIGNNKDEVLNSLQNGKSGIVAMPKFAEKGFDSQVAGTIKNLDLDKLIDKRDLRFMGKGPAYAHISMQQAISDAGLSDDIISNEKTGLIIGSGAPSVDNFEKTIDITREKGPKRVGPFMVPKTMSSTCSATLSTSFKIKGYNYSITSACSTSAHCIGNAYELISWGKQDVIFAGGGEELHWGMSVQFDVMNVLSSDYNDTPEKASRAYDKDRDGFVVSEGAGILVLEEYEHAKARGAKIYAEIVGYGANSDGFDMVAPSGEGAERCMKLALENVKDDVDYINAHGTSTPVGDVKELGAMIKTFPADKMPVIGSTKSYTGHSLGATGVQEIIYSLIMMENNFIAESINIENLDEEAKDLPIATQKIEKDINVVMSNSFGFGGTNASLVFKKYKTVAYICFYVILGFFLVNN